MDIDAAVTTIMCKNPQCVTKTHRIGEVWGLLSHGSIHHLPVLDDGRLVGMISTLDLAELGASPVQDGPVLAQHFLDSRLSVEQLMCRDVISIPDSGTVREAARLLSAGGFHSLPVVDAERRVVGIVTTTDLVGCLLDTPPRPAPRATPARPAQSTEALRAVLAATEAYLRSGRGEREHGRLERAVAAARSTKRVDL
jgi:CBS domain-containing protein